MLIYNHVVGEVPFAQQGHLSLVIMAGQSNMSGRGIINAAPPIEVKNAFVFGNDDYWYVLKEPVDSSTDQVDEVSLDIAVGYSPATAFAKHTIGKEFLSGKRKYQAFPVNGSNCKSFSDEILEDYK